MNSVVELNKVCKVFKTETMLTNAVNNVTLSINKGEYISISGSSGSGKSTLLSLLGLLDNQTSGSYKIFGHETTGIKESSLAKLRNEHIGFIFQSFNLINDLTVFENIQLPLKYRNNINEQTVLDVIKKVGLENRANHYPNQLSGGQQQRVAIARAIVGKPSILLADEPTGNLDSSNSKLIMDLLAELNAEGIAICLITHEPTYAALAPVQYEMSDGELVLK